MGSFKGRVVTRRTQPFPVHSILWIQPGDLSGVVLASGILEGLRERHPRATLTALVSPEGARLLASCPGVDLLPVDGARAGGDEAYRREIVQRIQDLSADLAVNLQGERDVLGDLWVAASGARDRIGQGGPSPRLGAAQQATLDESYTELVGPGASEPERLQAFLAPLDLQPRHGRARVWAGAEDAQAAEALFREAGLDPDRTIALLDAVPDLSCGRWPGVLDGICAERHFRVALVGPAPVGPDVPSPEGPDDPSHGGPGDPRPRDAVDLRGRLDLPVLAAFLARCRLAVGGETDGMHMACAAGTPHVVALGGGAFGRAMPLSPLTTAVVLPLDCFLCGWRCPYPRPHCLKDLDPALLARAVRETLDTPSDRPRVLLQGNWEAPPDGPARFDLAAALDRSRVAVMGI
jgi:ADP-heptose:LPS heptosyltransferase